MPPRAPLAKALLLCNLTLCAANVTALIVGFRPPQASVLSVERLNIVDSAGHLALVLANAARLPGAMWAGKEYPPSFVGRGKSAGMIFFNEVGDEVGGLIYEGARHDSSYHAFGHLSFDQWQQNQVVALQYLDNGAKRSAGVRVWDRPTDAPLAEQFALAERMQATPAGPVRDSLNAVRLRVRERVSGTPRLFLGSQDRVAGLELRDARGRLRLRLSVDSAGMGELAFLDTLGHPIATYPR